MEPRWLLRAKRRVEASRAELLEMGGVPARRRLLRRDILRHCSPRRRAHGPAGAAVPRVILARDGGCRAPRRTRGVVEARKRLRYRSLPGTDDEHLLAAGARSMAQGQP